MVFALLCHAGVQDRMLQSSSGQGGEDTNKVWKKI